VTEYGLLLGPDGLARCPWALSAPEYIDYHDTEWGRPLHGDDQLFERLTLEGFQSGLSWLTILRKRENFRNAFDGFAIEAVANYGQPDVDRLLADAGIVRNRAKIGAAITNARAARDLPDGLDALLWSFAPGPVPAEAARPAATTLAEIPAQTAESKAMAKALKRNGFVFVGPTTCYALMQAVGMVDDHLAGCHAAGSASEHGSAGEHGSASG